ncbi:patatin-like phospholipase family protein [Pleionea sediminis]|uniref:patatin-like phospholipase family protein n=1 Tax=Pleionea sediminis TaxID=2569479 RepID=UPI0013DD9BF5|nr:patatin-like phospholipase family protein [Pleionea sediminis]
MKKISLLLFLLLSAECFAERLKVGLALSGGGARGAAHIGVLRELEKHSIPVDYIAGTSMGSIVGGLYASGYSPDEIENIVKTIDWQAGFEDEVKRSNRSFRRKLDDRRFISKLQLGLDIEGLKLPAGIVSGQSVGIILNRLFAPVSHIQNFDNLPVPFRAVTTDLATGNTVIIKSGSVAEAITASMSIPGFLVPVSKNKQLLVDGGIANNLPISVVRNMGADIVIAVDISTPLFKSDELNDVVDVAEQLTSILTRKNTEQQLKLLTDKDILLLPELDGISTSDFDMAEVAIPKGEEAVKNSTKIKLLAQKMEGIDFKRRQKPIISNETVVIKNIVINNPTSVLTSQILNVLTIQKGDIFSREKLESNIELIYGLGYFSLVQYSTIIEDDSVVIKIDVKEKSWGPNFLRLGFSFSASEDIDNKINISANYLMTNINKLNGELSLGVTLGNDRDFDISWYQPLSTVWSPFLDTRLNISSDQFNFFDQNQLIAEFTVDSLSGDIALGTEIGNWGEIRFGAHYLDGTLDQKIGIPVIEEINYQDAYQYFKVEVDTLDSLHFPKNGLLLQYSYLRSNESLGSEFNYRQSKSRLLKAFEWHNNSITFGANYFRSKGSFIPLNAFHRSGGLLNFSGYEINQLSSENAANAFLVYMRRIKPAPLLEMYLGISYEQGQTWNKPEEFDWDNAIEGYSIFAGSETYLGPFYIAYGKNDNSSSFYIMLDKLF